MTALPEHVPTGGLPLRSVSTAGGSRAAAARSFSAQQASGTADGTLGPVLVIEPDDGFRTLLSAALSHAGFEVVGCKSARTALLALEPTQAVPALVVADVALSPMDGFCLCEQLRGEMRTAHVPVLLLAEAPSADDRHLARVVGAQDLLAKPVAVEVVVTLALLETGPISASDVRSVATGTLEPGRLVRALLAGGRGGQLGFGPGRALQFRGGKVVGARFDGLSGTPALEALLSLSTPAMTVRFGPIEGGMSLSVGRPELTTLLSRAGGGTERMAPLFELRPVPTAVHPRV